VSLVIGGESTARTVERISASQRCARAVPEPRMLAMSVAQPEQVSPAWCARPVSQSIPNLDTILGSSSPDRPVGARAVRKGQDYMLDVDGEPFSDDGKDEPKYGGMGTIFDWKGGNSFTLIVELGTNLPGPKIHVKATTDNGYNADNLAGSRIRYVQKDGQSASRAVLGISQPWRVGDLS
jgi:hypothetical protein